MIQYKEVTEMVPISYIDFGNGNKFKYSEFYNILEELWSTETYFEHILIYNDKLEEFLLENEVIKKTIRGSVCKGPKYNEWSEHFGI